MFDYDFKTLNDKEFEVFCADLLGDSEGIRFERFKPGRDAGVDGRYFKSDGTEVILQCKHWANTPIEQLISKLKIVELPKLERLNPARYLLAVSNPLSRNDKNALFNTLSPYIKTESDIFGKEDLNDLLSRRPAIERRHYKLWLCSSNILGHIINKPIFDRSTFSLEEIIESTKKYVPTSNHSRALDKLEEVGIIIITGEPGIGKTTLAEHLCLHYVTSGFELVKIANEIREAEAVFYSAEKSIFYFDDFLGRNYLEALTGHEGSQIVNFIKRVSKNKNKRFILTSRSTILNQGKILIDLFRHQNLERNEYELTLSTLSEMDKAKILYSHIWHSGLPTNHIDEIYKNKRYKEIIKHKNYNPRLISFLTDWSRIEHCPPDNYWDFIQEMLDNPTEVWENPFEAQQDDFSRSLVLLVTLERTIDQGLLAEAYSRYVSMPQSAGLTGRKDFLLNLRHLTGSLLIRKVHNISQASIDLFNPSIGDYVLRRYSQDLPTLRTGFLSLHSSTSLSTLSNLWKNNFIPISAYIEILLSILCEIDNNEFVGYSPKYIADAVLMLVHSEKDYREHISIIRKIIATLTKQEVPRVYDSIADLYLWALEYREISENFAIEFILRACEIGGDLTDCETLLAISRQINSDVEGHCLAIDKVRKCILDYLKENISGDVENNGIFYDVDYGDYSNAWRKVASFVGERLNDFDIEYSEDDVNYVIALYDVGRGLDEYYENSSQDSSDYRQKPIIPYIDEIDDLFERDFVP